MFVEVKMPALGMGAGALSCEGLCMLPIIGREHCSTEHAYVTQESVHHPKVLPLLPGMQSHVSNSHTAEALHWWYEANQQYGRSLHHGHVHSPHCMLSS